MYRSVLFLPAVVMAKPQLDAMKHDARLMNANQFNGAIGKFRDGLIHTLWFFKDTPEDDKYLEIYNNLAKVYKGIVSFHAIDCTIPGNTNFCNETPTGGVETTPKVMIYPPESFMQPYVYKNYNDEKKFKNKIAKMIPSNHQQLTAENVDAFMTTDVSKPKIILFSKQEKSAWVYNALSSDVVFRRTLHFGFTNDESLLTKYAKVVGKKPKLPTLALFTQSGKSGEKLKGELTFSNMKDFVNRYSESGMGDRVHSKGGQSDEEPVMEAKPWLSQDIPELTQASHRDVCFKNEGLCVIYLNDGVLGPKETEMMKSLQAKHTSHLAGRGTVLKWMWMDMKVETTFKDLFDPAALPGVVVFNPHKRLRFTKPEGEDPITEQGINDLIDKILGGDARFKVVKGQKLPEWAKRAKPEDDKKDAKKDKAEL